ncbi:MAG: sulfotransferase [Proteobacteria bacterium]|nr:MAG: sulfotransferase [Pseudomonadota bacterium]
MMSADRAADGPVFVVGCARSGTTLLQSILAQHQSLVCFPETNVLGKVLADLDYRRFAIRKRSLRRRVPAWAGRMLNAAGFTTVFDWDSLPGARQRLQSLGSGVPAELLPEGRRFRIRHVFREFAAILDYAANGRRWAEKSPQNVFCLDLLHRYLTDAVFVSIVREGKANVASLVDAGKRYDVFRSRFGGPDGIEKAVNFYNASVAMTQRHAGSRRHVIIRYEDLAGNPALATRPVGELLGLEFRGDTFSYRPEGIATANEPWKFSAAEIRISASKFHRVFNRDQQEFVAARVVDVDALFPRRIAISGDDGHASR